MSQIQQLGFVNQMIMRLGLGRKAADDRRPFRVNGGFLSDAELQLFHALRQAAGSWAVVCPKVALADLLTTDEPDRRGRIDQRRVDFVLFDPETMRPLVAIVLETGPARDTLVDELMADAGLPFQRVPVQRSYRVRELAAGLRQAAGMAGAAGRAQPGLNGRSGGMIAVEEPDCPLCGCLMALRTVALPGPYEGKQFWACADYPQCRGVREYRAVE
jgi:hypothetical protein